MTLVDLLRGSERFRELPAPTAGQPLALGGLHGSAKALWTAALRTETDDVLVVCCSDELEVEDWLEDLQLFSPDRAGRPAPVVLPELERDDDGAPIASSLITRRAVLTSLGPRALLLCHLAALMAPVAAAGVGTGQRIEVATGQVLDPAQLFEQARAAGLRRVPQVLLAGELSLRGDVLDLFPPGSAMPIRIEFFDDEVESIRHFHPEDQSSTDSLDSIEIVLPAAPTPGSAESGELPFPLDALDPQTTRIIVVEPVRFEEQFSRFTLRAGTVSPPVASFRAKLPEFPSYTLSTLPVTNGHNLELGAPRLPAIERGDLQGRILAAGKLTDRPFVVMRSEPEAERLVRLAQQTLGGDPLDAVVGSLTRGFTMTGLGRIVLNHGEFFGTGVARRRSVQRKIKQPHQGKAIASFFELEDGDLVVHAVHGIAKFVGLDRVERGGGIEDHLRLLFADDIEVLVPASKIDLVQKYVGAGQGHPKLDKLGGKSFAKRKSHVAQALRDMASDLLEIQIARAKSEGFSVPAEDPIAEEFERTFPYEDTPDQAKSTAEILKDLQSQQPMDRLLCGDVGFGKTELAMRAAFRVVSAGRQVAVLVPTTLLAEQHGRVFADRMASFPVTTAVISRLQTAKQKKQILADAKAGKLDILIGTHRLLSKDVVFKDLGLLVIDEEQRFGVAHKEKIRHMRANVDVLTMTATPIPRTLHMSLLGIRDISSLATPPPGRLEITTHVVERSHKVMREAILAELRRGGQVFFLHNRVHSLDGVREELESVVPEARIVVGHGQMSERELIRNMRQFLAGDADVLLSTTIVQSGLDIPRANTILVDNATHFGLAELHQLRGRVGRDIKHAHCVLMYDPTMPMSHDARNRLDALKRFSGLGAGFAIAMKDLEIRGAGNLLGPEQSGHIAAIGYDLYCKLLTAAVERAQSPEQHPSELPEIVVSQQVDVDLGVDAFLPESFVGTAELRLGILREMDQAADGPSYERMRSSLEDRFGRLPRPVENLLAIFVVKHQLAAQGMTAARFLPPDQVVLSHQPGRGPQGRWLLPFADVRPVTPERTHLVLPPECREPERILELLRDSLLGRDTSGKIRARGGRNRRGRRKKGPKS